MNTQCQTERDQEIEGAGWGLRERECVCVRPQVARRGPGEGERARGEESEESEKEHGAYRVPTGMQLAEPSSSSLVAWLASADAPEPGSVSSTWTTGIGAPNRDISSDRETASSTVQVPRVPRLVHSGAVRDWQCPVCPDGTDVRKHCPGAPSG